MYFQLPLYTVPKHHQTVITLRQDSVVKIHINKLRFVTRIVGTRATPLTTLTGRLLPGCLLQESFGQ